MVSLLPPSWPQSGVESSQGKTALVLSGGGNQGVSQVGMLRALVERGITPDIVVGTSAGSNTRMSAAQSCCSRPRGGRDTSASSSR